MYPFDIESIRAAVAAARGVPYGGMPVQVDPMAIQQAVAQARGAFAPQMAQIQPHPAFQMPVQRPAMPPQAQPMPAQPMRPAAPTLPPQAQGAPLAGIPTQPPAPRPMGVPSLPSQAAPRAQEALGSRPARRPGPTGFSGY